MRFWAQIVALVGYLFFAAPLALAADLVAPVVSIDSRRVARAIRAVENWDGKSVGASGERGPWQMLPKTWAMFSGRPFWWADRYDHVCLLEQERVGIAEVEWIRARLARLGLSESAWAIGLVHNAGYGRVRARMVEPRHREFADRVRSVYEANER